MSPKTYSLLTTGIFGCGLVAVSLLNAVVDPFGQYASGWFKPLIQDSRSEKLALFEACDSAPHGLILGSSRVMKIEPEYLQSKLNRTFFNAGVNHGRPTDYLAWIRHYEKRWSKFPEMVIIGVDTAAFNSDVPIDGRISGEPRLAELVPECVTWKVRFQLIAELMGFKQTKASLQSLACSALRKNRAKPTEYFAHDGRIVYERREEQLREGTYDFDEALRYNQAEFREIYQKFDRLVVDDIMTLVKTVELLHAKGTRVYLFNTPFHPDLREKLATLPYFAEREQESKQLLEILAKRFDLEVVDLSDPNTFKGESSQFVDGIHPLEPNTRRMMDCLFKLPWEDRYAIQ